MRRCARVNAATARQSRHATVCCTRCGRQPNYPCCRRWESALHATPLCAHPVGEGTRGMNQSGNTGMETRTTTQSRGVRFARPSAHPHLLLSHTQPTLLSLPSRRVNCTYVQPCKCRTIRTIRDIAVSPTSRTSISQMIVGRFHLLKSQPKPEHSREAYILRTCRQRSANMSTQR
jgi:hypothetical protein